MVSDNSAPDRHSAAAMLAWYGELGVDEAISDGAIDRFAESADLAQARRRESQDKGPDAAAGQQDRRALNIPPASRPAQTPRPAPRQPAPAAAMPVEKIEELARSCSTLDELARTLDGFDACPLKRTATQLCFADGLPGAHVMVIGEAPGRDEDEQGRPFVGKSGQLLDKMLAHIGLDRNSDDPAKSVFISNIVFWRPPGNRKPSSSEVVMCLPFVRRTIELARPRIVIAAGATPAHALLNTSTGITRLRGSWKSLTLPGGETPTMPTLHPSYLLRSPEAKKLAWRDLIEVKLRLQEAANLTKGTN